jgi:hypothetical protein
VAAVGTPAPMTATTREAATREVTGSFVFIHTPRMKDRVVVEQYTLVRRVCVPSAGATAGPRARVLS